MAHISNLSFVTGHSTAGLARAGCCLLVLPSSYLRRWDSVGRPSYMPHTCDLHRCCWGCVRVYVRRRQQADATAAAASPPTTHCLRCCWSQALGATAQPLVVGRPSAHKPQQLRGPALRGKGNAIPAKASPRATSGWQQTWRCLAAGQLAAAPCRSHAHAAPHPSSFAPAAKQAKAFVKAWSLGRAVGPAFRSGRAGQKKFTYPTRPGAQADHLDGCLPGLRPCARGSRLAFFYTASRWAASALKQGSPLRLGFCEKEAVVLAKAKVLWPSLDEEREGAVKSKNTERFSTGQTIKRKPILTASLRQ